MIPAKPIKQYANENGNCNGTISASKKERQGDDEMDFGSKCSSSTPTSTYCYTDHAPSIELFPSTLASKNPPSHSSPFGLSSSLSTSRIAGPPRSTSTNDVRSQILPAKLNAMLTDPSFSHIISWLPHGRAWIVLHPGEFKKQVAPIYFEQPNYSSFIRLINAWGFRRLSSGLDERAYYHELFLRGMPHLHQKMKRLTRSQKKVQINRKDEPDFYKMEPLPADPGIPSHLPPPPTSVAQNYADYPTSHYARGHEQAGYVEGIIPVRSHSCLLSRIPVGSTMILPEGLVLDQGGLRVNSPSVTAASSVALRMPSSIRMPQPYYESSNLNQYQAMSANHARGESKGLRNSLQATSVASFLQAQNQTTDHLFAVQQRRAANQTGVAIKRVPHTLASALQYNRESTCLSQVLVAPDSNPSLMQGHQVIVPTNPHERAYILALKQQQMEEKQQLIQEQQQISKIATYQNHEYKIALQQHDLAPHDRSRISLHDDIYSVLNARRQDISNLMIKDRC